MSGKNLTKEELIIKNVWENQAIYFTWDWEKTPSVRFPVHTFQYTPEEKSSIKTDEEWWSSKKK